MAELTKMTAEELIQEGRRLQRRTILLEPEGSGERAAIWYGRSEDEPSGGHRCWLSVDARFVPSFEGQGWLSILTNDELCEGGRVEVSTSPHNSKGVALFPREISVLPPIDAVIARGSLAVDQWLNENNWRRDWRYNSNFRDRAIVEEYETIQQEENPLYWKDAYATLGGWHMGWPDDDWHDLLDAKLLVLTYKDSEPWVEAWQMSSGEFKVIQRIT
jgi:hypothetical protein